MPKLGECPANNIGSLSSDIQITSVGVKWHMCACAVRGRKFIIIIYSIIILGQTPNVTVFDSDGD